MCGTDNQIQELFKKAVDLSGVVGAQLSIFRAGKQVDFVHGFANAELGIPMTWDTVVQVGSVTKVFNAVMIMTLIEEGKLELDAPVKSYIQEFELSDQRATDSISLRHLLSMSSGIDNGDYADYGTGEDAIARRVAALKTAPQHFSPGTHFGYSNAGTDISGYLAERVTGRIWDDLLKERVLEPSGLKGAVSLDRERVFRRVSVGHVIDPSGGVGKVNRHWSMNRGLAPAGATLTVSAHELVRFGKLFADKGLAESGQRVLTESSVAAMMTPQMDVPIHRTATSWCLGPCMYQSNGVTIWGHPGGNISGGAYLYLLPGRGGVVAWTMNTPSARGRFEKVMAQDVMQAAFGAAKPKITVPDAQVEFDTQRYEGTYAALRGECRIEGEGGELLVTKTWKNFANEAVVEVDQFHLVPLGDNRFLLDRRAQGDPLVLQEDMAFFGDDTQGRATNLITYVHPCSRTS